MYYTFFKTHMVIDTRRAIQTHTSGPGAPGGRTSNGIYGKARLRLPERRAGFSL